MGVVIKNHKFFYYSILIIGFLYLFYCLDCHAENYLKNLKIDVAQTFGAESDVPYYLLIGEAIFGGVTYIKTKNPMVLAGIPILMVFTHFALGQ